MASFVLAMLFVFLFMAKGAIAKTGGAVSETKSKATEAYGKLPLSFIQNNGQTDKSVRFYERGAGHATFFTEEGVYLNLVRSQKRDKFSADKKTIKSDIVKLSPLNANPSPRIIAEGPQAGKVNYFTGNDTKKWKTNIPTYGAVVYKDLYQGIDIKFYGNNRQLEYDIIVSPGADPSKVKLAYEGIQGLRTTEKGDLEISLKEGSIIQKRPFIYQEIGGRQVEVAGSFKVEGKQIKNDLSTTRPLNHSTAYSYGFEIASYNKDFPLIIDPVLVYSSYLGGSSSDAGYVIAVDSSGNAYVTGDTYSTDFPTQAPIQGAKAGEAGYTDAFVAKINAAGDALVYSTYLGGSDNELGSGIAVDGSGNVYVTGDTYSTDFPTQAPIQAANAAEGYSDAFIAKINVAGDALVYSTYLGGSDTEFGGGIAVDGEGNAYVTGNTYSTTDFPLYPAGTPIQGEHGLGFSDAFVTKVNAAGSAFVYSTYLGGNGSDKGYGIAVDDLGRAYVAGYTRSINFPTKNPLQAANVGGTYDAFVTRINAAGSALAYSTYLGGTSIDYGYGIAVDGSYNAYVTGYTQSTDFPTQAPIQGTNEGGGSDAFITKINATGSTLVYSTYLGGSGADIGNGIALDGSGNAYVTGETQSTDFPTQAPLQGTIAAEGLPDAFVTKLGEASVPPTLGTLTPSVLVSAPDIAQTFSAMYSDADGYEDIKQVYLRVHTLANGIYLRYDRTTNKLYLYNNAGTATVGSCTPGGAGTLTNTQGSLNCAATKVAVSGNNLTVKWNITPNPAFASETVRNLFMKVVDMSNLTAVWKDKGNWTITASNAAPTLGTLTPSVLASAADAAQTFAAVYRDADGYGNIKQAYLKVHTAADGLYLRYDRTTNLLYLYNNAGTATIGSCKPKAAKTLTNARGSLNCAATTVTGSGNNLTVNWNITPKAAFASGGARNVYMLMRDMSNLTAGWTDKGDWTINP